jgi:3-hydroxyisobutyrate dehydrogenase-like beta-hydroxyacid dehydrogenase
VTAQRRPSLDRRRRTREVPQAGAKLAVNGLFAAQLAVAGELLDILRAAESDLPATTELLSSLPVTSPVLARSLPRILQHDIAPKFPLDLVAKVSTI